MVSIYWLHLQDNDALNFICGYCSNNVASNSGYRLGKYQDGSGRRERCGIYICPLCKYPTFITPSSEQYPGYLIGEQVKELPEEIATLYEEARKSFGVNAYTGVALLGRKLLMNLAVNLGAEENLKFVEYVDYLKNENYIPRNSKEWVDHIRKSGNIATHEIDKIDRDRAIMLLKFVEMLLKITYEYPSFDKEEGSKA